MSLAYVIFAITGGSVVLTVIVTFGLRVSNLVERRRIDAYQETVQRQLAEYAVGARDDPPGATRTRLEREVMQFNLAALAPQLTGGASARVVALFKEYGFVESLHRDLDSRSPLKQIRASETLGTFRVTEAAPWLRERLDDGDVLGLSCARALADLGDIESLPAIITALSRYHSSLVEVTDIVSAFGLPAVPLLRGLLAGAETPERTLAADVLGEMRAFEAVPELRAALESQDDELAAASARALGRIGDPASAHDLAAVLGSERVWFVKVAAAHAIGATADPAAAPALVATLDAPQWYLRNAAAGSLQAMGRAGLEAVCDSLDQVSDRGVAHYAGVLDVADELNSVIDRAAAGDRRLERFVERACGAGVRSRIDILAGGVGPRADFCTRLLTLPAPETALT